MKEKPTRLQVAFLGGNTTSAVGPAHYAAISLSDSYELVAGAFSRHEAANLETGASYRVPPERTYADLDALIDGEKERIDAVIVLTPTDLHFEHVTRLLENGIPVICEKALAATISEIEGIRDVIDGKQGFLAVIYNYLGYPMIRELRRMITDGSLGGIGHIQLEMPQETFLRLNAEGEAVVPQDWRLRDGEITTVSLDLGVHLHMFLSYLIDSEPVNVVAKAESLGSFKQVVDNVNCIIELANGASCHMWYGKAALGNRNGMRIRIYGDKASAEWVQEDPEHLRLSKADGTRAVLDRACHGVSVCNQPRYTRFKAGHPAGFIEAYANYYEDVAAALTAYKRTGKAEFKDCYGIEESLAGLRLFSAVEQSSKTKSWVAP